MLFEIYMYIFLYNYEICELQKIGQGHGIVLSREKLHARHCCHGSNYM